MPLTLSSAVLLPFCIQLTLQLNAFTALMLEIVNIKHGHATRYGAIGDGIEALMQQVLEGLLPYLGDRNRPFLCQAAAGPVMSVIVPELIRWSRRKSLVPAML